MSKELLTPLTVVVTGIYCFGCAKEFSASPSGAVRVMSLAWGFIGAFSRLIWVVTGSAPAFTVLMMISPVSLSFPASAKKSGWRSIAH